MNVALIFAGGVGKRMNSKALPKQFLELHGKPILVYTMEHFQKHDQIDGIVLVCVEEWIAYCKNLIENYHLTKVVAMVAGGRTGQESIYLGLKELHSQFPNDTITLIHDGVRPLIDESTITNVIRCVQEHGSAITVSPAIETITVRSKCGEVDRILDRSMCQMAKAPQAFYLSDIWEAHQRSRQDNKGDFIDSASLMRYYGHRLYTVEGPMDNIKITTPSDFYIFRALTDARENSQIFG